MYPVYERTFRYWRIVGVILFVVLVMVGFIAGALGWWWA